MFLLPLTHLFTHLFLFLIDIKKWRLTSQPLKGVCKLSSICFDTTNEKSCVLRNYFIIMCA